MYENRLGALACICTVAGGRCACQAFACCSLDHRLVETPARLCGSASLDRQWDPSYCNLSDFYRALHRYVSQPMLICTSIVLSRDMAP